MATWTKNDLKRQFDFVTSQGWVGHFHEAANDYDFPIATLLALGSRETNLKNIVGDGGHGYGIMQIDDRSFPDWCHSGTWQDARADILKGALVLDAKRQQIRAGQGKLLNIGGESFTGKPDLTQDEVLRTTLAAYNSGLWAYYSLTKSNDPDARTTGRDYSADTLARAAVFAQLV